MPQYLGPKQVAECMRSGKKCLASELVRDGRNPQLLVLPEWRDDVQPQERPYIPDDIEGVPDFPMAPQNLPPTNLALTGVYNPNASTIALTWNLATLWGPRAKWYILRRSTDGGAYTPISINLVDYTNVTGHVAGLGIVPDWGRVFYVNQAYTDSSPRGTTLYSYQVAAVDDIGDDVAVSNTVSIQNGVVTGNPSGGDANFSNVVLLMHGDGANNGTIFTDSSFYNHLLDSGIALAPKPYTQTSVVKFGTAAIYTPPDANGMGMGSSIGGGIPGTEFSIANTAIDFTVECFFRQVAWDGTKSPTLFVLGCSPGAQIYMFLSNAGAGVNFLRAFGGPGNGDVWDTYSLPKTPITNGVWHYATLMRKTNVYYLYLDGTLLGSVTPSGSLPSPLTSLAVGSSLTTNNVDQVYIDELRYTVGVARYPIAGPIPIPTAPFPNY